MIFNTIKELIDQQQSCPICGSSLTAFLKERARNKENIPKKQIYSINSKFKNKQFEFKLDYNSFDMNINKSVTLDENNVIMFSLPAQADDINDAMSVLIKLFLSIEMHCLNKKCDNNYYIMTSILKPEYNSGLGLHFIPFFMDWECFNIKHLWVQNDHTSQITRIYNTDSISTPPITTSFLPISILNKEKIFNRIQTIVNFH